MHLFLLHTDVNGIVLVHLFLLVELSLQSQHYRNYPLKCTNETF
jgi:hypothetical protein